MYANLQISFRSAKKSRKAQNLDVRNQTNKDQLVGMKEEQNIYAESSNHEFRRYEIYKAIHLKKIKPESYLIKTVGVDCDANDMNCTKKQISPERGWSEHGYILYTSFELPVSKKRKRRKRNLKKKRHGELEETF